MTGSEAFSDEVNEVKEEAEADGKYSSVDEVMHDWSNSLNTERLIQLFHGSTVPKDCCNFLAVYVGEDSELKKKLTGLSSKEGKTLKWGAHSDSLTPTYYPIHPPPQGARR